MTQENKQKAPTGVSSIPLVRRPYRCPKCKHIMRLTDDDVWGKIIRCTNCAAIVADNIHTQPPNKHI